MEKVIVPEYPYAFQSGRHKEEYVESFVFRNSNYLFYVRNRKHRMIDALDQHLDFIFRAGLKLPTKVICPFCQQKTVKYFLFNEYLLTPGLCCCENAACQAELKSLHPETDLIPFRISSLGIFKNTGARRKAETFFRKIYGLPKRLTPQIVFSILREALGDKKPMAMMPPLRLRGRLKQKINAIQLALF